MAKKKLYVCAVVARDLETQEIVGLARPVIAVSADEAVDITLSALRSQAPEVAHMEIQLQDAKEIPQDFVEEIATEVLGWSKPLADK